MLKALLIIISAILFALSILPPNKPAQSSGSAKVYRGQPLEYVVRSFSYICCTEVVTALLSNAIVLLTHSASTPPAAAARALPYLCPSPPVRTTLLTDYSPKFLVGILFLWAGAGIRLWSYHTLGDLFTFEITVKDDHHLVTTGPYAYVRHPSYTGIAFLLFGVQLMEFGGDGYISACHGGGLAGGAAPAMWVAYSWQVASVFVLLSLCRRCGIEDAELHRRFGVVWAEYRETVPYCLLPGVL